jgi:predicted O-methyltransferase YrrM
MLVTEQRFCFWFRCAVGVVAASAGLLWESPLIAAGIAGIGGLFLRFRFQNSDSTGPDSGDSTENLMGKDNLLGNQTRAERTRAYYAATSSREYAWFNRIVGSSAMHTELAGFKSAGFMQQAAYVLMHLNLGRVDSRTSFRRRRILEVGSGKGANAVYIAALLKSHGIRMIGVDLLEEHVRVARDAAASAGVSGNATFIQGDVLDFLESPHSQVGSTYSGIYAIESLCHLDSEEDLGKFLELASRKLEVGGRIVIIDGFRVHDQVSNGGHQDLLQRVEHGFQIRRMASKDLYMKLASRWNYRIVADVDLTLQALPFWRFARRLALLIPGFARNLLPLHQRGNHAAALLTATTLETGASEYGILVLEKSIPIPNRASSKGGRESGF